MTLGAMTDPHILRLRPETAGHRPSLRASYWCLPLPLQPGGVATTIRMKCRVVAASALAVAMLLGACTYGDIGDIDNPLVRRVQWFSYAKGEDIQAACVDGAPERYRLIYNADFRNQVRAYEVTADSSGDALYVARSVPNGAALSDFNVLDTHGWWRWYKSETVIDAETLDDLRTRLAGDGYFDRRGGLVRLSSFDYYWLVTGCVDGKFESGAWLNGQSRIAQLRFAELLFSLDETGLAVAAPRWVSPGERYGMVSHIGDDVTIGPFWITVDDVASGK